MLITTVENIASNYHEFDKLLNQNIPKVTAIQLTNIINVIVLHPGCLNKSNVPSS